jgi:tetratricopeptide (TPR) repeat protein
MSSSTITRNILQGILILAGLAAVTFLSGYIEASRPALPEEYGDSDLTMNGSRLKGFALGTEGLIADWYYMRALQYVGDKIVNSKSDFINIDDLRDLNPRLLYPLLDNATDLDPHFTEAYLYGAIVLPAINPQDAIAIAEKGVANNPGQWRLYRPLGYIYWKLGQYEKASEIYQKGSQIEGSPPFLRLMSASMKTKGGSRETARAIYREMLDNATDEQVRITATRRLAQLDSFDERDAIDKVLTEFKETNGRCAVTWAEIVPKLMAVRLPENHQFRIDAEKNIVDPSDAAYILDQEKCRTKLDLSKTSIADQ